jgi:hypothetical protein
MHTEGRFGDLVVRRGRDRLLWQAPWRLSWLSGRSPCGGAQPTQRRKWFSLATS